MIDFHIELKYDGETKIYEVYTHDALIITKRTKGKYTHIVFVKDAYWYAKGFYRSASEAVNDFARLKKAYKDDHKSLYLSTIEDLIK